jgi:hypothetical protein
VPAQRPVAAAPRPGSLPPAVPAIRQETARAAGRAAKRTEAETAVRVTIEPTGLTATRSTARPQSASIASARDQPARDLRTRAFTHSNPARPGGDSLVGRAWQQERSGGPSR